MDKKESRKNILIEQRNQALKDVLPDQDLLDIDPDVSVNDYRYNDTRTRFYASMEASRIDVLSGYQNQDTPVALHCNICKHTWNDTPKQAKRKRCPICHKLQKIRNKDVSLWTRSAKIIADKRGKLVSMPELDPEKIPTIRDEFVIRCHRGHQFTSSHYYLRRDLWCPVCERIPGSEKYFTIALSSRYVYGRRMTEEQRQAHLSTVAQAKGALLLSKKDKDGKYTIKCQKCETRNVLTDRQILRNLYLCPSKCVRGGRYNLREPEIVL